MAAFENVSHIYDISVNKLANFNTTRGESDGLRKLVLLNNFVYTKFVVPEQLEQLSISSQQRFDPLEELWLDDDDVKKDEENWLDACLDDCLDEDEDYVYITKPDIEKLIAAADVDDDDIMDTTIDTVINNAINDAINTVINEDNLEDTIMEYEGPDDIIIPNNNHHHFPYLDMMIDDEKEEGGDNDYEEDDEDEDEVNTPTASYESIIETTESNKGKGFHPYWKDNSIISPRSQISLPSPSSHSPISPPSIESYRPFFDLNNNIPCIFQKYHQIKDDDDIVMKQPLNNNNNNHNNHNNGNKNNNHNSSSKNSCTINAVVLGLLDYHNQQQSSIPPSQIISTTKRSKDDFDILYSLTTSPRNLGNLDQGAIIDMFNMLDWYNNNSNNNNSNNNNNNNKINMNNNNKNNNMTPSFLEEDNKNIWFIDNTIDN